MKRGSVVITFLFVLILAAQIWSMPPLLAQLPPFGPLDGEQLAAFELDRVKPGDMAPDFRLADDKGVVHQLSQFRGKRNVVLVVYRGHW